jgi:hypothetical protein
VQVVVTHAGLRIMDEIRDAAGAWRAEEPRLYAERNAALEREGWMATAIHIGGLAAALALVLGATALAIRAPHAQAGRSRASGSRGGAGGRPRVRRVGRGR